MRFPVLMLEYGQPFDFLITGEGEEPFRRLVHALLTEAEPANVPCALVPHAKRITEIDQSALKSDLSAMPSTFDALGAEDFSGQLVVLETSRGCPYGCGFCEWAVTPLQVVPLERVFWEIDRVIGAGGGNRIFSRTARSI